MRLVAFLIFRLAACFCFIIVAAVLCTFQEDWLGKLLEDKLYLWPVLDSMVTHIT